MKQLLLIKRINSNDTQWEYNPVCHDDKIHIRFKHYTSNKMIIGFEDKLTFLSVYLVNSFLNSLNGKQEFKADLTMCKNTTKYNDDIFVKYITKFKDTTEFRILFEIVSNKFNCKDIRFSPLYSHKDNPSVWDLFGHMLSNMNTEYEKCLSNFSKSLGISLQDYLFNDDYILLISNFKFKNPNTKFENKLNRKLKKELDGKGDLQVEKTELW